MKHGISFVMRSLVAGLLILLPLYLAVLLLIKAMGSVVKIVRPFALLLPDWIPAELALSLILVLFICFLVGVGVRTRLGHRIRNRFEKSFFERIPGYTLLRSLTQQITGTGNDNVWRPALFESDEGLLPAFIIEKFEDERYTVFVPSIPTPFAGAVYVCDASRVHPLDVPFTDALKTISRWGSGAKDLVLTLENGGKILTPPAPS